MEFGAGSVICAIFYHLQFPGMSNKRASPKPTTRGPLGTPALQGTPVIQDATGAGVLVNIPGLLDLRGAFDAAPAMQGLPMGSALAPAEFMRRGCQEGG